MLITIYFFKMEICIRGLNSTTMILIWILIQNLIFLLFMTGGHNLHGTCFIDSVLNSIANSDSSGIRV